MKKRHDLTIEAVILVAVLGLFSLTLFGASGQPRPEGVVLTGWLHAVDGYMGDLVLVVELDGVRCSYAKVRRNGRFIVRVPDGAEVYLAFLKPGHLTKEVKVSTRNAVHTSLARSSVRTVKFDVVLEPLEERVGRRYDGPVGSLSFVNGSGCVKVRHHPKLVADESVPAKKP